MLGPAGFASRSEALETASSTCSAVVSGIHVTGQGMLAVYIVMATLLISAHTRNVGILAALRSAAVTRDRGGTGC